jgi:hypothetical protein
MSLNIPALPKQSRRIVAAIAMVGVTAGITLPRTADAAIRHELSFTFDYESLAPGVQTMHDYIDRCLPSGTFISGRPARARGPWTVRMPGRGSDYTTQDVREMLLSRICRRRLIEVIDVVVTPQVTQADDGLQGLTSR